MGSGTENIFVGQGAGKQMYSGNSNVAMGYQALYNYGNTSTIGNGNVAIGKYAMFYYPTGGSYNTAIGYSAYSLPHSGGGSDNVFIGHSADAGSGNTPSNAVAIGSLSKVITDNATAIGYQAYANYENTLILGKIDGVNGATANTKVGIGTSNPASMLEVNGEIRISNDVNGMLTLGRCDNSGEGGQINFTGSNGNSTWYEDVADADFRLFTSSASSTIKFMNIGSGNANLEIDGAAFKPGGGSWSVSSDRRSKENIVNYNKGLNELMQLRPVNFNYRKEFNWGSKTYTGLIAQEVEKIIPTMVNTKPTNGIEDFKIIDPNEITYMLINAVKELKAENESLKAELKKKNIEIDERLNKLENNFK